MFHRRRVNEEEANRRRMADELETRRRNDEETQETLRQLRAQMRQLQEKQQQTDQVMSMRQPEAVTTVVDSNVDDWPRPVERRVFKSPERVTRVCDATGTRVDLRANSTFQDRMSQRSPSGSSVGNDDVRTDVRDVEMQSVSRGDGHVSIGHGSQRVLVDTPIVYNRPSTTQVSEDVVVRRSRSPIRKIGRRDNDTEMSQFEHQVKTPEERRVQQSTTEAETEVWRPFQTTETREFIERPKQRVLLPERTKSLASTGSNR